MEKVQCACGWREYGDNPKKLQDSLKNHLCSNWVQIYKAPDA